MHMRLSSVRSWGLLFLFGAVSMVPTACTAPPASRTSVVTSIPVAALMVRPLLPDSVSVVVILPDGASPHGFEPRPSDARLLNSAAAIIAIHPHVDGWMTRLTSRPVAFMESEDDEREHDHADAHAWMDPVRVREGVPAIMDALCSALPDACADIQRRGDDWMGVLDSLDADIRRSVDERPIRPLITAQPFIHPLLDRYDIPYSGPVQDLPGQMASARRLSGLMEDVSRTGARTLVTQTVLRDRGMTQFASDMGLEMLLVDPVGSGYARYELYLRDVVDRLHAAR